MILLGWGVVQTLRNVKMIEAVAAFLALLSAGIFVAHAIDAYAHVAPMKPCAIEKSPVQLNPRLRHGDRNAD